MAKEEKKKSIAEIRAKAFKQHGLQVGPLSSLIEDSPAYTTGNLAIDHIFGVRGIPVGRSVELYGAPSSGKTTTAIQCAAALQKVIKAGGNDDPTKGPIVGPDDAIVYADYEHALDPDYVKALGLDLEHESVLFMQPSSLEEGCNVVRELIDTDLVRLVVFDSVASMAPSARLEAETGKSLPALQARLLAEFMQTMNGPLHQHRCTAIFLNHIFEVMEMRRPGMPPRTSTPGGRALKFYSSIRVEYYPLKAIKGEILDPISNEMVEVVVARDVKVKVQKNKVGHPFKEAQVRVRFGRGFDNFWTAMRVLISYKKVVYSMKHYYFEKSPELIHPDMARQATGNKRPFIYADEASADELMKFADTHPDWRDKVIAAADAILSADRNAVDVVAPDTEGETDPEQDIEPTADELADLAQRTRRIPRLIDVEPGETLDDESAIL